MPYLVPDAHSVNIYDVRLVDETAPEGYKVAVYNLYLDIETGKRFEITTEEPVASFIAEVPVGVQMDEDTWMDSDSAPQWLAEQVSAAVHTK